MLDRAKHRTGRRLPYARNINVRWGHVETDNLSEVHFDDDEQDRFGLRRIDVLVSDCREPGRVAVFGSRLPELKYQKALHRVRFTVKQAFIRIHYSYSSRLILTNQQLHEDTTL
jgi:type I restriction enzyme S subunit